MIKWNYDYLNVLPYEESLQSDNYFIRLLALLDRRLGKLIHLKNVWI